MQAQRYCPKFWSSSLKSARKCWASSLQLSTSSTPHISRMLCMDSCGTPTSTVPAERVSRDVDGG
jgi:hypothetical protein